MTEAHAEYWEREENGARRAVIKGIEIIGITLRDGNLKGAFTARSTASDLSAMVPEDWAIAYAELLLKSCNWDLEAALSKVAEANRAAEARAEKTGAKKRGE